MELVAFPDQGPIIADLHWEPACEPVYAALRTMKRGLSHLNDESPARTERIQRVEKDTTRTIVSPLLNDRVTVSVRRWPDY